MGDQVLIKNRHLKIVNSQKKRMIMPDIMLHTRNMIPVARPVSLKQSFNITFSENRPQILRVQNYKNNPALLFLETPSHTLYNPLENLFEVKKINYWKPKNQNTKYTISEKTGSPSVKKINISRNSSSSKKLSCKKKENTLHFPNTMHVQFESSTNNKDLRKASLKSIKLSRKCDLLQIKDSRINYKDKLTIAPKIETLISNVMGKPSVASLSSQSFHDITDTVSTISTLSVSNFKIENKKTFANIGNGENSASRITSHHLHPSNSECEINVLHYENDILSGHDFPKSHLKSTNTNSFPADNSISVNIQNDNENLDNKKSAIESYHRRDTEKIICDHKYSWEMDGWIPSFQRKRCNNIYGIKHVEMYDTKPYDCKIKYSWQVIGISTQTSYSLLQDLLDNINIEDNKSTYKMCNIKYSWQIIGISTQASLHDCNDPEYWNGMLLTPKKNYNENNAQNGNNVTDCTKLQDRAKYTKGKLKKYIILNNQQTQTFTEEENYAKYSWHNLIKQYL